jgi:UDP-glucose 4-epimerase
VRYVQLDPNDLSALHILMDECDEIVDLAYSTVPKTSFEDPVFDVLANLPFNVALIKMASERSMRKVVFVSSGGTVYGNPGYLPIDESHPTNPASPYGITKLAIEKYGFMYSLLRDLPFVAVRPGNPFGPDQIGGQGQGFVATALFAALTGKSIKIFGDRGTIRDYIYIDDLVSGIASALDAGEPGDVYNIGTGIGLDNRTVLDHISALAAADGRKLIVQIEPPRPFDVAANVLSSARLTYRSGWRPTTNFDEGLVKTWAWAKDYLNTNMP